MLIITTPGITPTALDRIIECVEGAGLHAHVSRGEERIVVGCIGDDARLRDVALTSLEGVEDVVPVLKPYRLAAREYSAGNTTIALGDPARTVIGGHEIVMMAGPCSVEGRDMLHQTAHAVQRSGARVLRGGAFKPRSSPWAFQGLGREALELLVDVRAKTGMPVVTEVMDTRQVELVAAHADILQIGARNMQNFVLLTEVGRAQRPVLLKRGLSATVTELLQAAEYILAQGNREVMLCERGIRTYETATRNTLDVAAIPVLKRETHLPVIVDPSHAAGRAGLVAPLAMAAIAAGADGLIVEVHPDPSTAKSDGEQSLTFEGFATLMQQAALFATAAGRTLSAMAPRVQVAA
jgi:3-deoxy-7-phosphoheptulonate synthase